MKIKDILRAAASVSAIGYPPLAAALPLINSLLPQNEHIAEHDTGDYIAARIAGLSPEQQARINDSEIDLEKTKVIEHTKIQQALAEVDITGRSTRPETVTKLTNTVCFTVIAVVTVWCISIINSDKDMAGSIIDGWPMIIALIAPMLAVIRSYFGMRTDEKNTRQHMAHGADKPLNGLAGIVRAIRGGG
jgi:hypothetical protein